MVKRILVKFHTAHTDTRTQTHRLGHRYDARYDSGANPGRVHIRLNRHGRAPGRRAGRRPSLTSEGPHTPHALRSRAARALRVGGALPEARHAAEASLRVIASAIASAAEMRCAQCSAKLGAAQLS